MNANSSTDTLAVSNMFLQRVVEQVIEGMMYLHGKDILHRYETQSIYMDVPFDASIVNISVLSTIRDLKPSNVLLDEAGTGTRCLLTSA